MTNSEFNEKYKDYLEDGHYGLAINIPTVTEFLDEMFSKVLIHVPGFKYSQIKLKFNYSRVYTTINHPTLISYIEVEIDKLVAEFDKQNTL